MSATKKLEELIDEMYNTDNINPTYCPYCPNRLSYTVDIVDGDDSVLKESFTCSDCGHSEYWDIQTFNPS